MKKIIYCLLSTVIIMNFSGIICNAESTLMYYDTVEFINIPDLIVNAVATPEIPEFKQELNINNSFGLKSIIRSSSNTFFRK